jgi:peptidoglycan/xylan/chitin deacetylase (PgdA/CDA1 family)
MVDAGWELDSHTLTHPDLTTLPGAELKREVAGSRRRLQELFGVPVDFFCYPAGRYDDEAIAAVKSAGYAGATTTVEGVASPHDDRFELPRVRVDGSDGVAGLAAKLG